MKQINIIYKTLYEMKHDDAHKFYDVVGWIKNILFWFLCAFNNTTSSTYINVVKISGVRMYSSRIMTLEKSDQNKKQNTQCKYKHENKQKVSFTVQK
jgi:hypothetical protein